MKEKIRVLVITCFCVFSAYCVYYSCTHKLRETYLDCGVIHSKSGEEIAVKNGSKTILLLNVDLKKTGFRSIETDYTTYFKYSKGENICFNIEKEQNFIHYLYYAVSFTLLFIAFFALIVCILD